MLPVVIVFAKAPAPFAVKTRLIPRIDADAACRLHEAFVRDTLSILDEIRDTCDVELHTDRVSNLGGTKLQASGDLGVRMLAALDNGLAEGRPVAAILGSDSPTLPSAFVSELLNCPADVCLGPAIDGGFYAIACRRTSPAMFDGVTWSSSHTLEQTSRAIRQAGLTVALGSLWYDVDSSEDLERLIADPNLRPAARQALIAEGLMSGFS
ncbi:MAG: TIGR04282 family arsenosugar biosynthesis glycosyltransferase [Acidobacteriota bacterium]|nr:TIGR04282 family arsenosugar biosynthesis glycosyltransferase [Acidobacteriota bacterium]